MPPNSEKIALVLGATGGIGGAVATALKQHNWQVRALCRNLSKKREKSHPENPDPEWITGDAMDSHSVMSAARGVSLIVHAVNPPGYRNWSRDVLPMLENTIKAAEVFKARILLPGTVYNYGPDAFPNLVESSPQYPETRKGMIRVQMEKRLKQASTIGVQTLIVRAGDFFGPAPGNNWFSQVLVTGTKPNSIVYPGKRGVGHQWAYIPDVAETMVRLLELKTLGPFETFHMDGQWDEDGTQMISAIRKAFGDDELPAPGLPWWFLRFASALVPEFQELCELRYLWELPIRLNNARLVSTLENEPHTPLDIAVKNTLIGLGCLKKTN